MQGVIMTEHLPVVTFHSLDHRSSVISFSPHVFRHGMTRLYENGFRTLSLPKAVDHVRRGKAFPERSMVITFDDGYRTVYDEAFPILKRYGMSATVFLTVGENPPGRRPGGNGGP
jgi:peptidoglycan/xylan/chitin deacetylase (PgdA/CDA1 family)